jgi:molecular chaperone GrpE
MRRLAICITARRGALEVPLARRPFVAQPLLRRHLSSADPSADATQASAKPDPAAEEAGDSASEGAEEVAASETEQLQTRIKELEEESAKKHDMLLRALADADNVRRRAVIDKEDAHKFAVQKFAKSLLDVADNLSRAAEYVPEDMRSSDEHPALRSLYEGVVMTDAVLHKCFSDHGLVKSWPMGEKFDPNVHEALFELPDPTKEPGTIAHVTAAGYILNERCIRAATVGIVAKPA